MSQCTCHPFVDGSLFVRTSCPFHGSQPTPKDEHLTLPFPPALNNMYATVRGRRVLSKEGRNFKADVAALLALKEYEKLQGAVSVVVAFYRPRRAGDLDNMLKATLDSLTGILWNDDSQVVEIIARRYEDKVNPRAEITVRPFVGESGFA